MSFDEMLSDGKAQASAAHFAGPRDIDSIEALEDPGLVYFGNADACVRDGECDFVSVGGGENHNAASRGRVLNGVIEQVLQNLGEAPAVSSNVRKRPIYIHRNLQVLLRGRPLRSLQAALHKLRDTEPVHFQVEAVRIHLGKFEQIIRKPREPPRMFENDLKETDAILGIVN